jgi:hypothetical protein
MAQNRPGGVFSSLRMGGKTALKSQHGLILSLRPNGMSDPIRRKHIG